MSSATVSLLILLGPLAGADDPSERVEAAREHLQKGRYAEAVDAYTSLAETGADPVAVAVGHSRALTAQGRWNEAVAVIEKALQAKPRSAMLRARLAELQFRQGNYEAAEETAERALKRDSEQPLARLVQADLYTETGRIEQADEAYRWFVRYYNRVQPQDAETLMLVARGSARYARWHSVSSIFDFLVNTLLPDALKDDPLCWQAAHFSGVLLLEKYNRAQALPEFRKALRINPRAAPVLVSLGEAALQQQDLEEAEDYSERALGIDPGLVPALVLKADVRLAAEDVKNAQKALEKALETDPHDQRVLARLAACYLFQDGLPEPERFERLLSHLDSPEAIDWGRPTRFETLVLDLAQRNPRPGYFLTVLGETLENRFQYDAAERLYRKAIDCVPQLAAPKTALGMLSMRTGNLQAARDILDEAFEADPFHVRVSNTRKVLDLLDESETVETEHFIIRVDSEDRLLGRYMAEYLEEIYAELTERFDHEPPQRTQVEVYHDAKGQSAHEWFSARMVGLPWVHTIGASTGYVIALASPTAAEEPFNWARVLKHEFVHVLTLQQTRFHIPHWFTEALAVTSEGYPRPALWDRLLVQRVPAGQLRSLTELNDGFLRPESSLDWQFAYCQSRLYAEHMVEKYGAESVSRLLEAYRRNLSTDRAIREVFGVDLETFEAGYRDYLNHVVSDLQAGEMRPEKTPAEIEKAYRSHPDDPRRIAAYAELMLQLDRLDRARELAEKALDLEPAQPTAAFVRARLALQEKNVTGALETLQPAWDPDHPDRRVAILLARLKLLTDDTDDAVRLYEQALERFPRETELLEGLAEAYAERNETAKQREILQMWARTEADALKPRRELARICLVAGENAQAVEFARMALHIDVRDVAVHRILGEAYLGLERAEQAVSEFQVAVELMPDDLDLRWKLAQAHLAAGNRNQAKRHVDEILARQPDHTGAQALLNELD